MTSPGRYAWLVSAVAVVVAAASACSSGPPAPAGDQSYAQRIEAARATRDEAFRAADNPYSPIPAADRASFPGLAYFPIDEAYHVPAAFAPEPSAVPTVIDLATSLGTKRRTTRAGTLTFTIGGATLKLAAFAGEDEGLTRLFVPFGDLTNGTDTYGGGRYIELERTATGVYDLDFNGAYHPFCVYNSSYECPIPPAENRLLVAVRAGERLRQKS